LPWLPAQHIIKDKSKVFNTGRVKGWSWILNAVRRATMHAAASPRRKRGADARADFPERETINAETFHCTSAMNITTGLQTGKVKPLTVESFPLKARVY